MLLFWFRNNTQASRMGVRPETRKPFRRCRWDNENKLTEWLVWVPGGSVCKAFESYKRGRIKWRELSGLDDWWCWGKGRDDWLPVREKAFPTILQLFMWSHFPEPRRWSKMLPTSVYCSWTYLCGNEFPKIFVADSLMNIKSVAVTGIWMFLSFQNSCAET